MNVPRIGSRTWRPALALIAIALLPAAPGFAGASKKEGGEVTLAPGHIQWQASFEAALDLARKEEKPLMVDFETEWCGFCKKLDRETYGSEQVIRFVQQFFVAVKVDGDKRTDLRDRYAVEGYPTIIFLSPEAAELKRIVGFRPPDDFLVEAGNAANASSTLRKLKEEATARPDDADTQRAYARALFVAGSSADALGVLEAFTKKHPEILSARLDLGDTLKATGRLEDACAHYEAVVGGTSTRERAGGTEATDTTSGMWRSASLSLARTRLRLRQYDKGVAVLTGFLKSAPEVDSESADGRASRVEALFLRAYAHATLGRADEALADLKTAEELDSEGFWGLRASLIRELVETRPSGE